VSSKVIRILSTIVGIIIFILIVAIGFTVFKSRAADVQPGTVRIEAISQNSARVVWSTDQATIGAIKYGTSEGALNFYAPESVKDPVTTHSVELTLLSPGSMYYFQIQIGDKLFYNSGVSWTFSTKSKDGTAPAANASPQPQVQPTAVVPTAAVATSPQPSPIQTVEIPTTAPATSSGSCTDTDCAVIKSKLGAGCSVTDLVKNNCLK